MTSRTTCPGGLAPSSTWGYPRAGSGPAGERMVRRTACVLLAAAAALLTGCVERRFRVEIESARGVPVRQQQADTGRPRWTSRSSYYGRLRHPDPKEGFQTQRIRQHVLGPVVPVPAVDFFAESFTPVELTDFRPLCYEMEPAVVSRTWTC